MTDSHFNTGDAQIRPVFILEKIDVTTNDLHSFFSHKHRISLVYKFCALISYKAPNILDFITRLRVGGQIYT